MDNGCSQDVPSQSIPERSYHPYPKSPQIAAMTNETGTMSVAKDQWWSLAMMASGPSAARAKALAGGAPRNTFVLARNALYYGLKALGIRPGERVLVPAYICLAAVDPLLA